MPDSQKMLIASTVNAQWNGFSCHSWVTLTHKAACKGERLSQAN